MRALRASNSSLRALRAQAAAHHPPPRPSLRRNAGTTTSSTTARAPPPPPPPPPSSPPRQPSFLRRNRIPALLSALALLLGVGGGSAVTHTLAPPALPAPGSREDGVLLADLQARIDASFNVQVLRGKCLGVARQLKGGGAEGWVELVEGPAGDNEGELSAAGAGAGAAGEAGGSGKEVAEDQQQQKQRLLTHLRGARGTGVERVFWDRGTGKVVAVVWFGGGVAGWPGVTHGGMLATALTEKLALAEHLATHGAGSDAVDGGAAAVPQRLPGTGRHARMLVPSAVVDAPRQPENLNLTYKKPTYANEFYVIRVTPAWEAAADEEKGKETANRDAEANLDWNATIETMDATICVLAKAKFAPSGSLVGRAEKRVAETAKRSYSEFREWLWPSRQKNSQIG